jgi:hypothetical protein
MTLISRSGTNGDAEAKASCLSRKTKAKIASVTEVRRSPVELVQGTLDMLLLKIPALEPTRGFTKSERLRQISGDVP